MTSSTQTTAAPPGALAGQILLRFRRVLAQYQQAVAGLDCPVARRWHAETGSSLIDFPAWLATQEAQRALVKVTKTLNAPLAQAGRAISAEPGAEVLLQMALLSLVNLLAAKYGRALKASAGPLLHLPMLEDAVLALVVACRYGLAVHLKVRYDSQGHEHLVVTNLIADREEVQAGRRGVRDNIEIERMRLLLAQQVLQRVLPAGSGLLGKLLVDDQMKAFVDDASDDGLSPIVVLTWDEADVARDIEQRWGVRATLRGDPASAPVDSAQRIEAQAFADAGDQVAPYFVDLARLLRPAPVATPPARPAKPTIFISYAREDSRVMRRLATYLRQHRATVNTWTDQELTAGERWRQTLLDKLRGCQVAVLLLSVDFNNSEFVATEEVPEFERRHRAGQLQVVPILAGPCRRDYFAWVGDLQLANPPECPLRALDDNLLDAALDAIAGQIAQLAAQPAKEPNA